MSTSYLLDSSVLVLLLKQDPTISQKLDKVGSDVFYVSTIALGELYYGAEHSIYVEKSRADVNALSHTMTILIADQATARKYGLLKHEQRTKGLMLPDNDLWIAATAFQYGLTLIARDQHFTWIAGLTLEYQPYIEHFISQRGRSNYEAACSYLAKVRTLYEKLDESEEWTNYIALLRKQNSRLVSFKQELAAAGL